MTKKTRLQTRLVTQPHAATYRGTWKTYLLTAIAVILLASYAGAQLPVPSSSQFDVTGFIQAATLSGPIPVGGAAHQGGSITVNGHVITVPAETIVILPASALTWQELFAAAP